ncbi:hypothetical protein FOLKNPGA_00144 [Legionella sp. PC1000]|nr:hypothetical protein FOLKNPGA_00144 [Legionella sp. PC1000]
MNVQGIPSLQWNSLGDDLTVTQGASAFKRDTLFKNFSLKFNAVI